LPALSAKGLGKVNVFQGMVAALAVGLPTTRVSEPVTMVLLGLALAVLGFVIKRRRSR